MFRKICICFCVFVIAPLTVLATLSLSQTDDKLDRVMDKIALYPNTQQKSIYEKLIERLSEIEKNTQDTSRKQTLSYIQNSLEKRLQVLLEQHIPISSHRSLILRFTPGENHSAYIQSLRESLSQTQSVFVFRTGKQNLSLKEMTSITQELRTINPEIFLFIDQEGGQVNRYTDFPSTKELSSILSEEFVTSRLKKLSEVEKEIFFKTFSVQKLYYYPSLLHVSYMFDEIQDEKSANITLELAAYTRLKSLKNTGINTYGIVLDLNKGNPAISGNDRSFSQHVEKYKKLVDAYVTAGESLGVTLYAKHFPGHGAGIIDSHKSVLDLTDFGEYVQENGELFEYFLSQKTSFQKGIMVGHMYLSDDYGDTFQEILSQADYLLTDDLGMTGYKNATGKSVSGKFFSTDMIQSFANLITVDTVSVDGVK